MNLNEFIKLHPNMMHFDRIGLAGIDFQKIHEKIECSRYLKTRRSMVYIVRNYAQILAGRYDDFKLNVDKPMTEAEEKQKQVQRAELERKEKLIERIVYLKNLRLSDEQKKGLKSEMGITVEDVVDATNGAIRLPNVYMQDAEEFFARLMRYLHVESR